MATQYKLVINDRYIQIIQCLSKVRHDFGVILPKILQDIETRILEFYEENLNSQVQPRVLSACLMDYYHMTGKIIVRKATIAKVFGVNRHWILKKERQYLEAMGLKLPPLPSMALLY